MSFQPVQPSSGYGANLTQINKMVAQLNKEQQVKAFKGAGGDNAIIFGKLPNGKYGLLIYEGETPRILIGESPDGTYGAWISKSGNDVLEALS